MILIISKLSSIKFKSCSEDWSDFDPSEEPEGEVGYLSAREGRLFFWGPSDKDNGLDKVEVVSQPMKANRGSSEFPVSNPETGIELEPSDDDMAPAKETELDDEGEPEEGGSNRLFESSDLFTITPTVSRILAREIWFVEPEIWKKYQLSN